MRKKNKNWKRSMRRALTFLLCQNIVQAHFPALKEQDKPDKLRMKWEPERKRTGRKVPIVNNLNQMSLLLIS
jgi:hypothetical protein